jgi:hypothetical protein
LASFCFFFSVPVVHDLADGRLGHRADLYEVHAEFLGTRQRLIDRKDSKLFSLWAHDAHLARLDATVRASVAVASAARISLLDRDGSMPPSGERHGERSGITIILG